MSTKKPSVKELEEYIFKIFSDIVEKFGFEQDSRKKIKLFLEDITPIIPDSHEILKTYNIYVRNEDDDIFTLKPEEFDLLDHDFFTPKKH